MLYPLCLGVTNWFCWRLPAFYASSTGLPQILIPIIPDSCKNPKTGAMYCVAFLPCLIEHLLHVMNSSKASRHSAIAVTACNLLAGDSVSSISQSVNNVKTPFSGCLLHVMNSSNLWHCSGYSVVCRWLTACQLSTNHHVSSSTDCQPWGDCQPSSFPIVSCTCTNALVRISHSNRKLDIRAKSPCFFVGNRI